MKIYNYKENGEYISTTKARKNPRKPDKYMLPARATTITPPEIEDGQVAVFDGNQWRVKNDRRGKTYYTADGVEHTINNLDFELPDGASFEPPPPTVEAQLKTQLNDIEAEYAGQMSALGAKSRLDLVEMALSDDKDLRAKARKLLTAKQQAKVRLMSGHKHKH
jgi:hypothetical protein